MSNEDTETTVPDPWHAPGLTAVVKAATDAVATLPATPPKLAIPGVTSQPQTGGNDPFAAAVARIAVLEAETPAWQRTSDRLDALTARIDAGEQAGSDLVGQLAQSIADLATRVRELELTNAAPADPKPQTEG